MIHAIIDLPDLFPLHTDPVNEPTLQILAHRDIPVDKRAHQLPEPEVFPVASIQVAHLAAMLTVHPFNTRATNAAQLGFQGRQVTAVDNIRTQRPEQLPQAPVKAEIVALARVQFDHLYIFGRDSLREVIGSSNTNDHMPVATDRGAIDNVYQAILQSPGGERVDDVGNQRRLNH